MSNATVTNEVVESVAATLKEVGAFFGMASGELAREMKALTKEDRAQLTVGIGNGTLTY